MHRDLISRLVHRRRIRGNAEVINLAEDFPQAVN
jgi:hypothetical protein